MKCAIVTHDWLKITGVAVIDCRRVPPQRVGGIVLAKFVGVLLITLIGALIEKLTGSQLVKKLHAF
jgi:hypothetical protein